MNEAEKLFRDDVREKSVVARSSHHKCRHTKKHRPSDGGYTPSAGCRSYNLNTPCDYTVFKTWPANIQKEYLIRPVNKYKVGLGAIARTMGCSDTTVAKMVKALGIRVPKYTNKQNSEFFMQDFGGGVKAEGAEAKHTGQSERMKMVETTAVFAGEYSADEILRFLESAVNIGEPAKITVSISKVL